MAGFSFDNDGGGGGPRRAGGVLMKINQARTGDLCDDPNRDCLSPAAGYLRLSLLFNIDGRDKAQLSLWDIDGATGVRRFRQRAECPPIVRDEMRAKQPFFTNVLLENASPLL